jgi:hypothetical protein
MISPSKSSIDAAGHDDRAQASGLLSVVEEMLRPGTFESDEELDEFLADLHASGRAAAAGLGYRRRVGGSARPGS